MRDFYRWGTGYAGIESRILVESEEASTSSEGHPRHDSPICSRQYLREVLESVIKIVNYVKTQVLKHSPIQITIQ